MNLDFARSGCVAAKDHFLLGKREAGTDGTESLSGVRNNLHRSEGMTFGRRLRERGGDDTGQSPKL